LPGHGCLKIFAILGGLVIVACGALRHPAVGEPFGEYPLVGHLLEMGEWHMCQMVMVEQQFMGWIIEFGLEVFGFFEP
jgi:hypothetical protein